MDWKQKLEAKAAARAAARAAEEEKGLSNNEIKVLRQAKAQANADAKAQANAQANAEAKAQANADAKYKADANARVAKAKAAAEARAEAKAKALAAVKAADNAAVAYYAKAKANAAEAALVKAKANAKLAEEAVAKEAAKEAAKVADRQKLEAERAVRMEEARRRADEEFKEEEAAMLRKVAKSHKPLTKMFVNLITKYFKLKLRFDKVTLILANLDKRGIDKALPSYIKYANEFTSIGKSLASLKHMFDTFLAIGQMKKWRETYVNGSMYSNILEQLYASDTSGLLLTEQWKSGYWERENKPNAEYEWRGLSAVPGLPGMEVEDQFNILEERDKKHISDSYNFKFPTFIHSYMESHKLFDMFVKKFDSEPTSENNIADFNMLLPKFIENKVKIETKGEMFKYLFKHSKYTHILDGMYNAELSENFDNAIEDVRKTEDEKIKEELKSLVKPLGANIVRENQNNAFGGGTKRNRKNRKNRRGTRRI